MAYYKVLLVGASGKGKTYSFKNLAAEGNKTCFINVENKPLPFKGKFAFELIPENSSKVREYIQRASISEKYDCIIVDSFSAYIDMLLAEARAVYKNWDIWNYYNLQIGLFHETVKKAQKEIFVTAHYEIIGDELTGVRERRTKVKGKEWEGFIEKEYTMVIYTDATPVQDGRPENFFTLVNDGTTSAKCPPDIFGPDILRIPNDSKVVFDKIKAFRS